MPGLFFSRRSCGCFCSEKNQHAELAVWCRWGAFPELKETTLEETIKENSRIRNLISQQEREREREGERPTDLILS
jgi:hypothetical protein